MGSGGFEPVLVGGMALVVLGSRRVTRDFDFVIAHPGNRLARMIELLYDRGLELVSRLQLNLLRRSRFKRYCRGP
jgi:hypothetical protein